MKKYFFLLFLLLVLVSKTTAQDRLFLLQDNCIKCHLWCETKSGENSVVKWKRSVHFRPDTACADCHGGDRLLYLDFKAGHMGMPDRNQSVGMCEQCHEQAVRDFIGRKVSQTKNNKCTVSCVDCHGHHQIEKPDAPAMFQRTCRKCHSPDKAAAIANTIQKTESRLAFVEAEIKSHETSGLPVLTPKEMLKDIQRQYARGFHKNTFSKQEPFLTGELSYAIDDLEDRLGRSAPNQWHIQGYMVIAFLGLICVLLTAYLATLKKKE